MSHVQNDIYLESMLERFDELKDGNARNALLTDMRWQGFDTAAENLVSTWYMERLDWLNEKGVDESEVHIEHTDPAHYNLEFYFDVNESGNPGDDYQVDTIKCFLPVFLNVSYWTDNK